MGNIRLIQEYLVRKAEKYGLPQVENTNVDRSGLGAAGAAVHAAAAPADVNKDDDDADPLDCDLLVMSPDGPVLKWEKLLQGSRLSPGDDQLSQSPSSPLAAAGLSLRFPHTYSHLRPFSSPAAKQQHLEGSSRTAAPQRPLQQMPDEVEDAGQAAVEDMDVVSSGEELDELGELCSSDEPGERFLQEYGSMNESTTCDEHDDEEHDHMGSRTAHVCVTAAASNSASESGIIRAPNPLVQTTIPAKFCPAGGMLESGMCYRRCKRGWNGIACHCWRGKDAYFRGCGLKPRTCQAASYRQQTLPPSNSKDPFTMVLSADPQLFRVVTDYDDRAKAVPYNARLVESINRAAELEQWPPQAGGGAVQHPESLVVLGDLTEFYTQAQVDAFRHFYDASYPRDGPHDSSTSSSSTATSVQLPTWLLLGNHDYVNNVQECNNQYKGSWDKNICARSAVDTMRSVLTPGCDDVTWGSFPRRNVTSFDAGSMAYSFDRGAWQFVVLQYNPRYSEPSLSVTPSMAWLASELSSATSQQRKIVLLLHAHRELGLVADPTFARLIVNSNVMAIFYGHVHIRPWGFTGNFPNTHIPMFNCGASWYHVYCMTEFSQDRLRVGAVWHNGSAGDPAPHWAGVSVHGLLKQQRVAPVLLHLSVNSRTEADSAGQHGPHLYILAVVLSVIAWQLTVH
eukprot:gene3341-3617_t